VTQWGRDANENSLGDIYPPPQIAQTATEDNDVKSLYRLQNAFWVEVRVMTEGREVSAMSTFKCSIKIRFRGRECDFEVRNVKPYISIWWQMHAFTLWRGSVSLLSAIPSAFGLQKIAGMEGRFLHLFSTRLTTYGWWRAVCMFWGGSYGVCSW
jgi:hypothetical protein